ncbi:MAG: hypothetical protein K8T25_09190, partial [Planctomycetia bacterium]|nr:hypothetical protein [Planctomycetia bacterium]
GVLRAQKTSEVAIVPEQWAELTVSTAVPHGSRVHRGDVLVQFDTRKIDLALRDMELEIRGADLALAQTREALALLKKSTPAQLADAEAASRIANENMRDFVDKVRPRTLKDIDFQFKQAEQFLTYQEEELKQLEKMYKKDDLVETTEEIILRRCRNEVEAAKHNVETSRANRDWQLTFGLPRQEASLKQAVVQATLALDKAKATVPQALAEQEINLKKLEYEAVKRADRLAQLRRDRERLAVKSPADGTVYYGQCTRGAWPAVEAAAPLLATGAPMRPFQVFMTVVDLDSPVLLANVDEGQLRQLKTGLRGTFKPKVDPLREYPATLTQLSAVPSGPGRFDAEIDIDSAAAHDRQAIPLVPGMNGTARFTVYTNPKALMIPAAAVRTDRDDDETYVMLVDRDGPPQRRVVKVGQRVKEQAEILSGLKAGDVVRLKDDEAK